LHRRRFLSEVSIPAEPDPLRAALERALGSQYDIVRLLGRGGMGAVYLGRERALERQVAIKVLPPEAATDAESRERFRREARTAAKLTHPNIVPLHTFGDVEGMLYFVMGYVRGESLAERMRREGKLPEEDVRRILGELADALGYAHRQGVIHRDIKPDNILLEDETGRPMLTDFGVAKARASGTTLTEAGAVVGTPYYMSPEQASGSRDLDGRSDLYSLGVMGYAMLSGRLPFEGESFRDVIVQHVTQEPAPLAALVPDVLPDLSAAVMRCLAKDPAQRWGDAQGLRDALTVMSGRDEELPEHVAGTRSLLGAAAKVVPTVAFLWWALELWDIDPGLPWWFFPLAAATIPLMAVSRCRAARVHGLTFGAALRMALRQPKGWGLWWPASLRPADARWPRLPAAVRGIRGTMIAFVTVMGVVLLGMFRFSALGAPAVTPLLDKIGSVLTLVGNLGIYGTIAAGALWGRRHGLRVGDAFKFVFFGGGESFWRTPQVAALLLPPAGRVIRAGPAEPRSPEEYARAIRDLEGQLPSGTQATVADAADAAHQLLATVAVLDAELARLAQDADPQELEAVEAKLRALGPETADDGDVRRQKRALLVPQRDLLRQLNQRLAEATDRRAQLLDLLRTLWLQVANLRAQAAADAAADTEVTGKIRILCQEISAHADAAQVVRAIAP
jgi:predicted Ser/Thr protein kinase